MNTPIIRSIREDDIPAGLPVAPGDAVYAVVASGSFGGRTWQQGELVVSRALIGPAKDGAVVLVPVGKGHAMLGHRRSWRLYGAHDEPCSESRWQVAGEVHAVWNLQGASWVHASCEPVQVTHTLAAGRRGPTRPSQPNRFPERRQLGLFATAA
jgi:hypothetical protein